MRPLCHGLFIHHCELDMTGVSLYCHITEGACYPDSRIDLLPFHTISLLLMSHLS